MKLLKLLPILVIACCMVGCTGQEKPEKPEEIKYNEVISYNNGAKLNVDSGYLVPVIESGIVVYMGEKDGYGYTIIVQQNDGVDCWYSNINTNIKLYDYIEKGSLLGEAKDSNIYLYFQKNGEFIDYKEYI